MEKSQVIEMLTELKQALESDASNDDAFNAVGKVLHHRSFRDADEVIAESVGLSVKAVTIVRAALKALADGETQQKSRLEINHPRMRLLTNADPSASPSIRKTFIPGYKERHGKKVQSEDKPNEA